MSAAPNTNSGRSFASDLAGERHKAFRAPMTIKGSVRSLEDLPDHAESGDCWAVLNPSKFYVWRSDGWSPLPSPGQQGKPAAVR